jgi:hypothetical protein
MRNNERGIGTICTVGAIIGVLVLAAASFSCSNSGDQPLKFETDYQAVLLINGSVYFGKLEGYGTKFPVLRDVYYVQSGTNPETKQVTNVLVKRGKELHGPDRMYLNPIQIILVEPVGRDSKVAQLIADSKAKGQ